MDDDESYCSGMSGRSMLVLAVFIASIVCLGYSVPEYNIHSHATHVYNGIIVDRQITNSGGDIVVYYLSVIVKFNVTSTITCVLTESCGLTVKSCGTKYLVGDVVVVYANTNGNYATLSHPSPTKYLTMILVSSVLLASTVIYFYKRLTTT